VKVGFIVDGVSEFAALPTILTKIVGTCEHDFLTRVLFADLQPHAPFATMARECKSALSILEHRGADMIVVIMDREGRDECPPQLAAGLASALAGQTARQVAVVIKDRKYENWLVADLAALRAQDRRFTVTRADARKVEPNLADRADGLALIKRMVIGTYDKVEDSKRIVGRADALTMARNSRSFRRFLRVVGHPLYSTSSKTANDRS